MKGFNREQAAKALSLGWTQAEVRSFQDTFECDDVGPRVERVFDWAVLDDLGIIRYRRIPWTINADRVASMYGGEAIAYTDGSGNTMKTVAGIGIYIEDDANKIFIAEHIGLGSNNRAELCAVWRALRQFPQVSKSIVIRSDSEYSIGALTLEWARNVNGGLIRRIREDLDVRGQRVRFEHVKGHSGIEGNEIADELAYIGRKLVTTPTEYEG